jgi:Tfp pilus assembly protein PilP
MRTLPLLVLLAVVGCDSGSDRLPEIRVVNASAVDFDAAEVAFLESPQDFGPVGPGAASDYEPFETAYRYGYVRVETEAGDLVLQPIDYVGEAPLPPGRYTFRLGVDGGALTLDLEAGSAPFRPSGS